MDPTTVSASQEAEGGGTTPQRGRASGFSVETEGACGNDNNDHHKCSAESTSPPSGLTVTEFKKEIPSKLTDACDDLSDNTMAWCQPCKAENEHKYANAFCRQCSEYLCSSCIVSHRRFQKLKSHKLLEQDKMPKPNQLQKSAELSKASSCPKHVGYVKFYCRLHDIVGCGTCMVLEHRTCKIKLVTDAAENLEKLEISNQLVELIGTTKEQLENCTTEIKSAHRLCNLFRLNTLVKIKNLKTEANEFLDTKEQEITENVETFCVSEDALLDCLAEKCADMKTEIHEIESQTALTNRTESFIARKQTQARLKGLNEQIRGISSSLSKRKLDFVQDPNLIAFLSAETPLGKIEHQPDETSEATNLTTAEILQYWPASIFFGEDSKESWITGMARLDHDNIVLVDNINSKIKLFDLVLFQAGKCIPLPSRPWDVTRIEDNEIAITFPFRQTIKVYRIADFQKHETRSIRVKGECHGIDYHREKLVVSFVDPEKVEVFNFLTGAILHRFDTDSRGNALFIHPMYVCFGEKAEHIFVTEQDDFSVMKITLSNCVSLTYKDLDLHSPAGVVMTVAGNVVVCSKGNNCIHLLSHDLTTFQTLPFESLQRPQAVYYFEDRNTLLVSSGTGIRVYDNILHVIKFK